VSEEMTMCGIAARFSMECGLDRRDAEEVLVMTEALRHRGPDAGGFLDQSPLAVLGHRRLSIIDVAQGHQPMSTPDRRVWIVFNGQIYNYRALREELRAKGHEFRTNSDTETILYAYREWGERAPERLEGMFAFVILDLAARRLFLARDHLGKKPLYLRVRNAVVDVASELPVLRCAADWKGELDPVALAFYLRLGYIPSPWSVYRDVQKLRPGECCTIDVAGVRRRRYWDLATVGEERSMPAEDAVEAIEAELRHAVTARLMSEVPLGAFLSGGIDSGLIVALMAAESGPGVKTVSVGFAGDDGETAAARLVADRHRTDHAEYTVDADVRRLLSDIPAHFGEPFADSSAIPTWYVSREARRRVTVALSGDGGDEGFGGYDFRFGPHARDARLRELFPGAAWRSTFTALAGVWPSRHDLPRAFRLASVLRNLGMEEDRAFYFDLCFTPPAVADRLAPSLAPAGRDVEEHVRALYREGRNGDPLQAIMRADARFYLPENGLVKVDRMSMAHSLEVRSPFLSKRVLELAFSIPSSLKVSGGESKALLRRLARRHLPHEIVDLPKRGFHMPVDDWLRQGLRRPFEESLLDQPDCGIGWIDRGTVAGLWEQHQSTAFNHGQTLWMLWALRAWVDSEKAVPPRAARPRDLAWVE
jgi:asparagine synthase (glutamine-hydrolysing)